MQWQEELWNIGHRKYEYRKESIISSIRPIDLRLIADLVEFVRGPGFVLDFSDTSFSAFFAAELSVDIEDPKYSVSGRSKGKRLKSFLMNCDDAEAYRLLTALWEYRREHLIGAETTDPVPNAAQRFQALMLRLSGSPKPASTNTPPVEAAVKDSEFDRLKADLLAVSALEPQARGYAFETFLKRLFEAFQLAARDPFRTRGEQIDGSFELDNEVYLVEAKWHGQPIGVADLHTFHGKIEQKAAWTRGLFVSNSGFTADGLAAFGRGKRVICMDGLDLYEMLDRKIPLPLVLKVKIRHAAETGSPFVRVRDLNP